MTDGISIQGDLPISNEPLIYDVGMNNGDDCEYYLAKGFRVVAIEANPTLCRSASRRFKAEIADKRLTIVNIGVGPDHAVLPFYVHKSDSVLSTFVPFEERIGFAATQPPSLYKTIPVEVRRLSDIVNFFGYPDYIKIDVEGFDAICLRDLDRNNIYPLYLSAEAHAIDTFCHLFAMGYRKFKWVSGAKVAENFANLPIGLISGETAYFTFKHHSAGPFGEDIPGDWLTADAVVKWWAQHGGGWYDLHARL